MLLREIFIITIFGFSIWTLLLFIPVGIIAGILSTVTGLASLASYPALLYLTGGVLNPISANITNTSALLFNVVSSGLSSKQELKGHGKELMKVMTIIFFGGIVGVILLTLLPSKDFEYAVPVFIAAAGIGILLPSKDTTKAATSTEFEEKSVGSKKMLADIALIVGYFLIGIYGSYFGAAAGVILLAVLSRTSKDPFPVYNAIRNVAMGSANVIGTILYSFKYGQHGSTHIYWALAIPLGIGFLIGGYVGPKLVRILPTKLIKVVTGILALVLAYTQFSSAYSIHLFYFF
ncbi:sulfite exporter TauE/SafE family protein [Apilactobacillus timberlakei]|uniref:sulfite exporter TauE/SafE family protein n=1 Tax=Apilactobacillus timberlakei TaxID=2008380 RepID=UPI001127B310|nr:sulfite exporter TauE/SafE family protein [Apilactobacillus timberlakei]TPR17611.1 sulfite exporter TauE/SafE family protein [Apilactobacillus timberlakei]TPR19373.1 sulfite exporter TauE/SafE family protein [Apilactobacillus timberlakei]TPR19424.1 sulfite exporter TauE/SafE family protein [Apilactobacillus timberlakei]TPR20802.1 sulfite exporter TauE/SafE family protein [Apilactobacillus timberlakei]TPR22205.1 sulfite exporter TauE/SafE family protein [Apilactobacillus timberlakei]